MIFALWTQWASELNYYSSLLSLLLFKGPQGVSGNRGLDGIDGAHVRATHAHFCIVKHPFVLFIYLWELFAVQGAVGPPGSDGDKGAQGPRVRPANF